MTRPGSIVAVAAVWTSFVAGGCAKEQPSQAVGKEADEVMAKLAAADLLDGKSDKVVSKCASCALAMNGDPQQAWETHGYSLHFCSAGCKSGFEKQGDQAILTMEIPTK